MKPTDTSEKELERLIVRPGGHRQTSADDAEHRS